MFLEICRAFSQIAKIRPQIFISAAPFELFGRNFCHLATLGTLSWRPAGRAGTCLCESVSVVRTENTCRPGRYGRESSLQGGQQAGLLAVPARPALNSASHRDSATQPPPHPEEEWGLTRPVPVLPGGRNSGQKAQKGPQKKKICGRILVDFTKNWQKRGRRKFSKKFLIFSCDNHV